MPERFYNYCPYCGKKLVRLSKGMPNFCTFCGKKLKQDEKKRIKKVQCTICHSIVDPNIHKTIKCPYCGSIYHSVCVSNWLQKYNACPMCLNVFLFPNKVLSLGKY